MAWLDRCVATVQAPFAGMTRFVLPGASSASGAVDVARAEVRTAERRLALLAHSGQLPNETSLVYLNRLSLLLYYLALAAGCGPWGGLRPGRAPETRPEA